MIFDWHSGKAGSFGRAGERKPDARLLDTERIVEIVVVDGQPHGRELLHDVYLLRRVDLVLLGIDELPSLDVEAERRENRAHIFQAIDMKRAFSILR